MVVLPITRSAAQIRFREGGGKVEASRSWGVLGWNLNLWGLPVVRVRHVAIRFHVGEGLRVRRAAGLDARVVEGKISKMSMF